MIKVDGDIFSKTAGQIESFWVWRLFQESDTQMAFVCGRGLDDALQDRLIWPRMLPVLDEGALAEGALARQLWGTFGPPHLRATQILLED